MHEVLGRRLDAGGATAAHAGSGNEGAHRARWWALSVIAALLIGLAVLATAAPEQAAAQAETTLVSNIQKSSLGYTVVDTTGSRTLKNAQPFTTGSNSPGYYQLSTVKIRARSNSNHHSPEAVFTINAIVGNAVGEVLYTLTAPTGFSSLSGTEREYSLSAPSNAVLEPSTTYALVFATNSGGYQLAATGSNDLDAGSLPGWDIQDRTLKSDSNQDSGAWKLQNFATRIALLGEDVAPLSIRELPGEDFPGRHSQMRTTKGLVDPRQIATGELTAIDDDVPAGSRDSIGLRGDYFRLKVQPGHSYRLQVFFKETAEGSVPLSTGGSIKLAFYDIATGQRAGLSPGSDHNRDDGVTIVHLNPVAGREYYVKVNAYDHYNGDKSTKYHGKYHLELTNITFVTLLTSNLSSASIIDEEAEADPNIKDETVGTTSWGISFRTGTHTAGYKIDRIQLFIEDANSRRDTGGDDPGRFQRAPR